MKMLVIGMDGVQEQTFDRGWTPFIKSLIEHGDKLKLKEDLISRGWAEIILGKNGCFTNAVYEGPMANGSLSWTEKYSISDTPGLNEEIKPIWQQLNELGYRVGIMNVPTTFPAPEVKGFFVSGGGGGGPAIAEVSASQCYPKEIENLLKESDYIVDERLPNLLGEQKLYDPKDFYDRIETMNEKRTSNFIKLAKRFDIDFGFVVYKTSLVTAETLVIPELERCCRLGKNSDFVEHTKRMYQKLDLHVKQLIDSFPEANIILVSDHSTVLRQWSVNANSFLEEIGLQKSLPTKRGIFFLIKSYKHLIPLSIRKLIKKSSVVKASYESMNNFDAKATLAFSITFSNGQHGIFINDKKRFGGPVTAQQVEQLTTLIIEKFNTHPESLKHNFTARKSPKNSVDRFPDIILDLPDGYATSQMSNQFVKLYQPKVKVFDLKEAAKGKFHTIKGHQPLCVNFNANWLVKVTKNSCDLTLVYQHIVDFFAKKEK